MRLVELMDPKDRIDLMSDVLTTKDGLVDIVDLPKQLNGPMDLGKVIQNVLPVFLNINRIIKNYIEFVEKDSVSIKGIREVLNAEKVVQTRIRSAYAHVKELVKFDEETVNRRQDAWTEDYVTLKKIISKSASSMARISKDMKNILPNENYKAGVKELRGLIMAMEGYAKALFQLVDFIQEFTLSSRGPTRVRKTAS